MSGEAVGSNKVCGNGGTMSAHMPSHGPRPVFWRVESRHEQVLGGGGGGEKLGTDSKGDSKIEHFSPYRPSFIDS